ncbi:MAG: GTPase Era [Kiritimatiellae bacterium]|nr:GTPase Era [Kiritimatiellia bacterium]
MTKDTPLKAGKVAVVAVVGRTNAGKSTLVNRLVGEKVSIVSPVAQTTRNTVRGIVADPRGQLVLLDTPGLHKAVGALGTLLNRMARRSSAGADIVCAVFDAAREPQLEDVGWMQRIAGENREKAVFVLNKADLSPFFESMFHESWDRCAAGRGVKFTPKWVKCSAIAPDGGKAVLDALFEFAEEGEKLFDDDIATDYPRRMTIADSIREKYLARLHSEVPHELGVRVVKLDESEGPPKTWDVAVEVLVNRASQKPIAIGRRAETVKYVRKCAERELSELFGVRVRLNLLVKASPNWMKNARLLAEMGYLGELM